MADGKRRKTKKIAHTHRVRYAAGAESVLSASNPPSQDGLERGLRVSQHCDRVWETRRERGKGRRENSDGVDGEESGEPPRASSTAGYRESQEKEHVDEPGTRLAWLVASTCCGGGGGKADASPGG